MKRFASYSIAALIIVLTALLSVVNIDTKALAPHLKKAKAACTSAAAAVQRRIAQVRAWRDAGASWLTAVQLGARPAIAGGATQTEGVYTGEAIVSERDSKRREKVTVLSGQNLKAGAVVGRVAIGVGKADIPAVVGTGDGTMSALYAGPEVEKGNYAVKCTVAAANGGTFSVTAPSGKALPNLVLTVGAGATTKYRSRHINFSVTDGATDFAVNDTFTIAVAAGAPTVVGTGDGTISALSLGPDAKPGQYLVECITAIANGGTFKVVAPDGEVVAVGSIVAGAGGTLVLADQRQLNLTITDGATDFAVGDKFQVFAYNELVKKAVAWDPTTFDGRHRAVGVLYEAVDASAADKSGVIVSRDAEVLKGALQWGAAITAAEKESAYGDLAARGVIALDTAAL